LRAARRPVRCHFFGAAGSLAFSAAARRPRPARPRLARAAAAAGGGDLLLGDY